MFFIQKWHSTCHTTNVKQFNKNRRLRMKLKIFTILFVIIFLCSGIGLLSAQTQWNKYLHNPVLTDGPTGEWDVAGVQVPSVIFDGNIYHMWYIGFQNIRNQWYIGYATSTDGITWTKYNDPSTTEAPYEYSDPVLKAGPEGSWDENGINQVGVIKQDNEYKMWYTSFDGDILEDADDHMSIGYATSTNGINWNKYDDPLTTESPYADSDPVFTPGNQGSWDSYAVQVGSSVLFDGDQYHMWYLGFSAPREISIGYATSSDGINWNRYAENPVIVSTQSFETEGFWMPRVIYDNELYHIWYSGWNQDIGTRIGYATSADGINWNKDPNNPVFGPSVSEGYFNIGSVLLIGDVYHMWYNTVQSISIMRIAYAQDFTHITHSKDIVCDPSYVTPGNELQIQTKVINPQSPMVFATAYIEIIDSILVDSVELSQQTDSIWTGSWLTQDVENIYNVGVKAFSLFNKGKQTAPTQTESIHNSFLWERCNFTTAGPITIQEVSEDTVSPGDRPRIKLTLLNQSESFTFENVEAMVSTEDTSCVLSIGHLHPEYGEMGPGQTATTTGFYTIFFKADCTEPYNIDFNVTISTEGMEFWEDSFPLYLVSGINETVPSIPNEFALEQNYPNPFNPKTVISYQLPVISEVEMSIYNLLGQEVATLVSERQQAGYHKVEWDASDFASGIYYYRIVTGEFDDVKKMVLIR